MDREKEIALALSACPASVAGKGAVYVLDSGGYVKVRDSQNGFTAIVQHSQPTSQEPQCMDAEGTRTFLPRILKVAELRAEGKSPEEIKRFVADAFAKGVFQVPTRPGVDYMLSTENLVPVDEQGTLGQFPPHVMFYGPYLTNADLARMEGPTARHLSPAKARHMPSSSSRSAATRITPRLTSLRSKGQRLYHMMARPRLVGRLTRSRDQRHGARPGFHERYHFKTVEHLTATGAGQFCGKDVRPNGLRTSGA